MLDVRLTANRRNFLRVGGLAGLGVSLASVLKAEAAGGKANSRAKSVILVYLGGGMSHHDTFDPKPDAAEEIRGKYKAIATRVPGLNVGEKLPMMASVMDKIALVRSCSHNNDHHETATNWVLSGRFGTPFGDYPAIGAVVAHESGFQGTLPPYVAVPRNPSFTWELGQSAFLGGRFESFKAGDPSQADYKVQDVSSNGDTSSKRAVRRETLLKTVDGLASKIQGNDQIATYDEFQQRAAAMLLSTEAKKAFDITAESDKLRDRYGRTTPGQSMLMARRLIESGTPRPAGFESTWHSRAAAVTPRRTGDPHSRCPTGLQFVTRHVRSRRRCSAEHRTNCHRRRPDATVIHWHHRALRGVAQSLAVGAQPKWLERQRWSKSSVERDGGDCRQSCERRRATTNCSGSRTANHRNRAMRGRHRSQLRRHPRESGRSADIAATGTICTSCIRDRLR